MMSERWLHRKCATENDEIVLPKEHKDNTGCDKCGIFGLVYKYEGETPVVEVKKEKAAKKAAKPEIVAEVDENEGPKEMVVDEPIATTKGDAASKEKIPIAEVTEETVAELKKGGMIFTDETVEEVEELTKAAPIAEVTLAGKALEKAAIALTEEDEVAESIPEVVLPDKIEETDALTPIETTEAEELVEDAQRVADRVLAKKKAKFAELQAELAKLTKELE